MLVNVHDAKSQLSKLIAEAESGNDVVIARNGRPAVRLVPVQSSGFRFGALAHLVTAVPDFNEPMGDDDLDLWEGEG
ncbi:MAG: type II toxin-antitoxin system prevent-host-death family antitoxin [Gammaproteobacteria bacterium]|nr:type II toxin-antitoxin system prevent-host-death family antitoxin [Gammaproteobacteria bacterium]